MSRIAVLVTLILGYYNLTFSMTIGVNNQPQTSNVIKPFLGVNSGPTAFWPDAFPTQHYVDVTRQYKLLGVNSIRIQDYFGPGDMMCYFKVRDALHVPNPKVLSHYDFDQTIKVYKKIVDAGFIPFVRLGQGWRNMSSWGPFPGTRPTGYYLGHKNGCRFWPNISGISQKVVPEIFIQLVKALGEVHPHLAKQYLEFWSEPNPLKINTVVYGYKKQQFKNYEWDGSSQSFYRLFVKGIRALKQHFPKDEVGGPGLAVPPPVNNSLINRRWMKGFWATLAKTRLPLDFISWHLYSSNPRDYIRVYHYIQNNLDRLGYHHAKQIISEWNLDLSDPSMQLDSQKAAALLTAVWITLQQLPNLEMAYYYRGNDGPFVPNGSGFPLKVSYSGNRHAPFIHPVDLIPSAKVGGMGLLYGNGKLKATALAFHDFSQLAGLQKTPVLKFIDITKPEHAHVYLLAARANGVLKILMSYLNHNPAPASVNFCKLSKVFGLHVVTFKGFKQFQTKHLCRTIVIRPNSLAFIVFE